MVFFDSGLGRGWERLQTCKDTNLNLKSKGTKMYLSKSIRIRGKGDKLNKGVWGMPRLSEAKKDVISCEKLRGLAHTI